MGKRAADPSATAAPAPKKQARLKQDAILPEAAPAALHPTIKRLREGLESKEVEAFIASIKQPKPMGGLDAYDEASYKASMKACREYTCIVRAVDVDILRTVHPHIVPSWGTLVQWP